MKRTREEEEEEEFFKLITIYNISNDDIDSLFEEEFSGCFVKPNPSYILCHINVANEEKFNQFISNGMNNIAKKINKNFEYKIENSENRIQTRAIIRPVSDEDEKQICQLFVKALNDEYLWVSLPITGFLERRGRNAPYYLKEKLSIPCDETRKNEAEEKIKFILQCIKKHYE